MSKVARFLLAGCLALVLLAGVFSGGVIAGWFLHGARQAASPQVNLPSIQPGRTPAATQNAPGAAATGTDKLFTPFWEAWQIVHDEYVDQPVDDLKLMQGAIRGMMEGLGDQHSSYMDPEEYRQANLPMEGSYDGIGAYVDTTQDYLTVTSPMTGSPAEKAGLKPGDKFIKIDGVDMTGVDGSIALKKVLGPAGTQVTLTVLRKDVTKPFDVTITRAKIILKSVEYKMLDNNVGYVQLNTFADKTTDDLRAALKDIMGKKPKGLVLDLRNNGGGYLRTAIEVVSQFIPKGVVMYERYGDGTSQTYEAIPGGLATDIPLVVLVNEGTASASEITAGAIQDYARGKLVGMKTYGKGSVQNWIPLQDDQGAVRVTVARWLTPKERQIHQKGLEPDVKVEITEDDIKAGKDPQLDKAVELITTGN
jgi:carboxyl-terminal processing protease